MKEEDVRKAVTLRLPETLHIAAAKRRADLRMTFSDYIAKLIQLELKDKPFDNVVVFSEAEPADGSEN